MSEWNYYHDPRVLVENAWKNYNSRKKKLCITFLDPDNGCTEIDAEFRCVMEVCPLCEGHGKVVNPSVDCNGLTAEDFDEDPDLMKNYTRGMYDIACPQCGGNNVVPVIDTGRCNSEILEKYEKHIESELALRREQAAEMAMGA